MVAFRLTIAHTSTIEHPFTPPPIHTFAEQNFLTFWKEIYFRFFICDQLIGLLKHSPTWLQLGNYNVWQQRTNFFVVVLFSLRLHSLEVFTFWSAAVNWDLAKKLFGGVLKLKEQRLIFTNLKVFNAVRIYLYVHKCVALKFICVQYFDFSQFANEWVIC